MDEINYNDYQKYRGTYIAEYTCFVTFNSPEELKDYIENGRVHPEAQKTVDYTITYYELWDSDGNLVLQNY